MSSPSGGFASVDVLGMSQAQNVMQEIYGQLNSAMQSMTEQQSTLAANWSGEASTSFGQALSNFIEDFNKINGALVGMISASIIDATALSWGRQAAPKLADEHTASFTIAPQLLLAKDQAGFGVHGTF